MLQKKTFVYVVWLWNMPIFIDAQKMVFPSHQKNSAISRRPRDFFGITATFSHDVIFEQCNYGVGGMKLPVVLAVLTGTLVLACSTTVPAPVEHTPNIGATSSRGYVN